jgi:hypothetical protein
MSPRFPALAPSPFSAWTTPAPELLGKSLADPSHPVPALLHLSFGDAVAHVEFDDVWSTCCVLLLQADLVREKKLNHFVIDVEQLFAISYRGDLLVCRWSIDHVFTVRAEAFAKSLELVATKILGAASSPAVMSLRARSNAWLIRGQPYSSKFSRAWLI